MYETIKHLPAERRARISEALREGRVRGGAWRLGPLGAGRGVYGPVGCPLGLCLSEQEWSGKVVLAPASIASGVSKVLGVQTATVERFRRDWDALWAVDPTRARDELARSLEEGGA